MTNILKFRQFVEGKFHYWGYINNDLNTFKMPVIGNYLSDKFVGVDCRGRDTYEKDIIFQEGWEWGAGYVFLKQGECGTCDSESSISYICSKDIEDPDKDATYNLFNFNEIINIGNIYEDPHLLGTLWKIDEFYNLYKEEPDDKFYKLLATDREVSLKNTFKSVSKIFKRGNVLKWKRIKLD